MSESEYVRRVLAFSNSKGRGAKKVKGRAKPRRKKGWKRELVWKKSGGRCWYCGMKMPPDCFTIDHVIPRSTLPNLWHRTRDCVNNLVPACRTCNEAKGDGSIEELRVLIESVYRGAERVTFQFENKRNFTRGWKSSLESK